MKFKIRLLGFIFLFGLTFMGCNKNGSTNIKKYYFPLEHMMDGGKVYEYTIIGDSSANQKVFYKYEYFINQEVPTLVTTQFDNYCFQQAIYRDEIVYNGALRLSVRGFDYNEAKDTMFYTDFAIESPNVIPFTVEDSSRYLYKVSHENDLGEKLTIEKQRVYVGKTAHIYKGQPVDAVDFDVYEYRLEQSPERGDFNTTYLTRERYADDLGLVFFTEKIGNEERQYRLTNIYLMEEFTVGCERMMFDDY